MNSGRQCVPSISVSVNIEIALTLHYSILKTHLQNSVAHTVLVLRYNAIVIV